MRGRGDVLIGRRCYFLLRHRHDVPIRCRGDVTLKRLGDVPSRCHWMFYLRRTCDIPGTRRETSLQRCHDVLLPGGCVLYTKTFLSVLNDNELKQAVIGKQVKFTHIAKPTISNGKDFIKAVNYVNNFTKCFTIKDINSTFNDIGNPFSLFHSNINSLSFHFDQLQSLISKSKNYFQIIGISETRLLKISY